MKRLLKEREAEAKAPPDPFLPENIEMIKNFDKLQGFSDAQKALLQRMGLPVDVDTLDRAPIQDVTSKADVKEVALLAPVTISRNPAQQNTGQEMAAKVVDEENKPPPMRPMQKPAQKPAIKK